EVFALQDRVIEHILAAEREAEAKAAAPTAVDPIQQTVTETLKDAIRRRSVEREAAKVCIGFLSQAMGKALPARLRSAYDALCDVKGSSPFVVGGLLGWRRRFVLLGIFRPLGEPLHAHPERFGQPQEGRQAGPAPY